LPLETRLAARASHKLNTTAIGSLCLKLATTKRLSRSKESLLLASSVEELTRRSLDAVIRVFDEAGNLIETHEQAGDSASTTSFARCLFSGCTSRRDNEFCLSG
jgi:hypothetical protein